MSVFNLKKKSFAVCAAMGECCAILLTAVLLLPVALAVSGEVLPEALGGICAVAAAGISVFVPTVVIARIRARQVLATAGAIALGYVVLAALCCALGGAGSAFGLWLLRLAAAVGAGGLMGAVLSIRQNTHRKRKR